MSHRDALIFPSVVPFVLLVVPESWGSTGTHAGAGVIDYRSPFYLLCIGDAVDGTDMDLGSECVYVLVEGSSMRSGHGLPFGYPLFGNTFLRPHPVHVLVLCSLASPCQWKCAQRLHELGGC